MLLHALLSQHTCMLRHARCTDRTAAAVQFSIPPRYEGPRRYRRTSGGCSARSQARPGQAPHGSRARPGHACACAGAAQGVMVTATAHICVAGRGAALRCTLVQFYTPVLHARPAACVHCTTWGFAVARAGSWARAFVFLTHLQLPRRPT